MPSQIFLTDPQPQPSGEAEKRIVFNRLGDVYLEMYAELHGSHDQKSHGNERSAGKKAVDNAAKGVKSAKLYADNADLYDDEGVTKTFNENLDKAEKALADEIEKEYKALRKMKKHELFAEYKLGNKVTSLDPNSPEFDKQSVISDILYQRYGSKRIGVWVKHYSGKV